MNANWIDQMRLLKSIVISFIAAIVLYIHFSIVDQAFYTLALDFWTFLIFICFLAVVYFVSLLFVKLNLSNKAAAASMFFYFLFLIWSAQGLIHTIFFTEPIRLESFQLPFLLAVTLTVSISLMLPSSHNKNTPVIEAFKNYYESRPPFQWGLRVLSAIGLMVITYFALNHLIFPFLEPYYSMSSSNFHFTDNGSYVSSAGMFIHALVMLVVFLPVFALWRGSKSSLLFWLGFPLFLLVALQTFVLYNEWPLGFRFPLFVHLTLTMYIQAIVLVHLFYEPTGEEQEEKVFQAMWTW
ncbi:hypothetical protein [Salisediminibacterium selenitireducens]|uniref:Uncharacterized protein n=1 Tax=Bacillus selenitireducens (strain ATCC 700615 / DSM 15326 / MLS10) TaxID=439292 RepID=D6XUT6_BACIE|nr:hypothetical protein [Salisediminibacterium selenitireducens]ADH99572.1 hypothetical protein Bsel_2068 [[Bacillus] selenitireducens MLS10]